MRERSTWNLHEIAKQAADGDIYTMNQDHPQPGMDEYVIGDSSDFAEDVHSPNTWDAEYTGEQVKRNEIGMPELRSDTFNHAEKTASDRVRLKKAELCVAVAKLMMRGMKTASADAIEDQAVALMYLPDQELINTHRRLAQEQEEESDDDDGDESDEEAGQAQQKQARTRKAQQQSQQFAEDAEDDEEGQSKQAADDEAEDDEADDDEADDEDDAGQTQSKQAAQQGDDDEAESAQGGQSGEQQAKQAKLVKKIKLAMGQQQQLMAQMQQLLQQAMQQQEVPAVAGLQGPALAQQQQQAPALAQQTQQVPALAQEDELDQLLANDGIEQIAEDDIEIEPTGMDTENVVLAGEDAILRSLFADDQEQADDEGDGQTQEAGQAQGQQAKQAAVRTASTRTVGTRPSAGVTKLGGSAKTARTQQVDNLSSLWASAPDVRAAFGLK